MASLGYPARMIKLWPADDCSFLEPEQAAVRLVEAFPGTALDRARGDGAHSLMMSTGM